MNDQNYIHVNNTCCEIIINAVELIAQFKYVGVILRTYANLKDDGHRYDYTQPRLFGVQLYRRHGNSHLCNRRWNRSE